MERSQARPPGDPVRLTTRLATAIVAGTALGNLSGNIMPLLLPGYGSRFALTNTVLGVIAAAQLLTLAVTSLSLSGRIARLSRTRVATVGLALEAATGMSLARLAQQELWRPVGAEHDAYYFLTRGQPRHALGGGSLNATLRDMARVGQLVLDDGFVGARSVVPTAWIERSRRPVYAGHAVGELGVSGYPHYGYSTQWWLVGDRPAAITGLGVYGQYLWIDPASQTVIVRTATWPTPDDAARDAETYAALCALCARLHTDAGDD